MIAKTVGKRLSSTLATMVTVAALLAVASPASAALGITSFDGGAFALNGDPVTQAGAPPQTASTTFFLTEVVGVDGYGHSTEDLKDVFVDLPAGLIGNPNIVSTCTEFELQGGGRTGLGGVVDNNPGCPLGSQVGFIKIFENGVHGTLGNPYAGYVPLFNMKAPRGEAALLGFSYFGALIHLFGELRRDDSSPGSYRIRVVTRNAAQFIPIAGASATVWGVPADPSLDTDRGWAGLGGGRGQSGTSCADPDQPLSCRASSPISRRPFFTLPTSCVGFDGTPGGPVRTDITVAGWQGGSGSASFLSHDNALPIPNLIGNTGCGALDYSSPTTRPTLKARPTTNVADSPTGFDVDLHIPQSDDPDGNATAHLRDTTVTLPEGLNVNPASANGLDACSSVQIDLRGPDPANCPPASKLGTVEVETPLLDHLVPGAVYIAKPYDNPFDSLLAIYIAIDDPISGTVVKIAGEVHADPITGQLTTTVEENPQVPFERFRLNFFGGAGGSLRTPAVCGTYSTTSSLTPWSAPDSGPPAEPSDTWSIDQGPSGNCANTQGERPHVPSFDAGSVSPIAGAHSPFVVNLRRDDGSQEFSAVTVSPPQGLVAKLAGTTICSDGALAAAASKSGNEEKSSPSCPAASEVGNVTAAAGAGPAPYYAPAKAYVSGPYKGAPLSLAVITPATAGPFDLGTIVTRIAVYVNSKTAEITAKADPIPSILQGIPLDVRSVHVALDRPNFSLNPTSCNPMAVNGLLTSTLGQTASLTSRFQLGECGQLGFKPKMVLTLRGGTKRGKHPALTVDLQPRAGDANISSFSLAMPRSEFLENAHIRTICTRPDFAADNCPAGAIYGEATVTTPLLDYPLTGHVYLRSSDNLLPDVVPDLRGPAYQPIRLESAGRTDSVRGGIRNTLDFVPDAPFSQALIQLQGGNKGLLVNSRNICDRIYRATVKYTAHNGLTYTAHPKLRAQCGKKAKKGKRRAHRRG